MPFRSTYAVHSPTPILLSLPLVSRSQQATCRSVRHFQTSSSSQRATRRSEISPLPQTETLSESPSRDEKQVTISNQNPVDIQKGAEAAAARARARVRAQLAKQEQTSLQLGSLAHNSLFSDQRQIQLSRGNREPAALSTDGPPRADPMALEARNPSHLAVVLNPRPKARAMWQRRMVIRSVRQRGRLTKTIKIERAERSSLSKSHFFKTSMKKLAPLARQIAGKPIDEAILQMRFSKKKVAKEVREHLLHSKHQAIVARGMGLGHLEQDAQRQSSPPPNNPAPNSLQPSGGTTVASPQQLPAPASGPSKPRYLPGTSIPANPAHRSPTDIYISQAWINRGPYGKSLDHRAFGRVNIMRPPSTGISVLLKEERTRAREAAEKETKKIRRRMGKNMWTQLPDRKVTRQGQYLLW